METMSEQMEIIIQATVLSLIQYLLFPYDGPNDFHMFRGDFHLVSDESII